MKEFMNSDDKVVVIGGGAAGMIAAWRSAALGAPTILLEKNNKLGIKILISGGGKCNLTHAGSITDLFQGFRKNEANFLKPSFYKFSNNDIIGLLETYGVKTFTREDGKVFPTSNSAKDVVEALKSNLIDAGVDIRFNSEVQDILIDNGKTIGVQVRGKTIHSSSIILATGGLSYPKTGTTGDGYKWAKKLGHTIIPLTPALAPMKIEPKPPTNWSGVAFRDCILSCFAVGKKKGEWRGDFLFTHEGISGPTVLELSRDVTEFFPNSEVTLVLDVLPDQKIEKLDDVVRQIVLSNPNREIKTILKNFLPNRIIDFLLEQNDIVPELRCSSLNRLNRTKLVKILKEWKLGKVTEVDIEKGEVTAGGIPLKEVNPKTMRSRIVNGLFLCGEVLDIAGRVGGYNLQAAYSTGYVAGESAALENKKSRPE
jgi:predicted Rossmann fold flavoprotein